MDSYWGTFYTEYDRTISADVTAYYVSSVANGYAHLEKLAGTVLPAKNGYLLNTSTATNNLSFAYSKTAPTESVTGNMLFGSVDAATVSDANYNYYILGRTGTDPDYTYGFYWQNGTSGTSVNNGPGKAYLRVSATGGAAKGFSLSLDGGTTGINTVNADETEEWYTLQGVRLTAKPTQSGLYIRNGKKVIIK
jgi:hypothetical protein